MNERFPIDRRHFLGRNAALAAGGTAALFGSGAGSLFSRLSLAAELGAAGPLAPRPGHFAPRADRVIVVFLTGGYSQVDTFDPKPKLRADHGKPHGAGF